MNQYHYELRKRRVAMRFVHATGKTWYKVLYQHTMYLISLSNISIKTNFKQIKKIESKLTYSEGDYILCMPSRYWMPFIHQYHIILCDHFQCHCTIVRQRFFVLEKCRPHSVREYWNYVLGNNNVTVNSLCLRYLHKCDFPSFQWHGAITK